MKNLNYENEIRTEILNKYEEALNRENSIEKRLELKYELRAILFNYMDCEIELPISINKVNRLCIPEQFDTVDIKIGVIIENLKFLYYKHRANSKNILHELLNHLLELAIETTDENTLNIPKSLSVEEILTILDTVPICTGFHPEECPWITTVRDLLYTIYKYIDDARDWNISEAIEHLTIGEIRCIYNTLEYMQENKSEQVLIKLT